MKELVEDHARKLHPIELQQVGQHRIAEEAERRECDRRAHQGVEAILLELGGLRVRIRHVEVAAIRNRADDRKPPRVRRERIFRRRHHYPYDRAFIDLGDGAIGVAHVEAEPICGEPAQLDHHFELVTHNGIEAGARQLLRDRAAIPEQTSLLVGGARQIAELASGEACAEARDCHRECNSPGATD